MPTPDRGPFSTLARAIVGQQLSNRAATTIWGRVADKIGSAMTPAAFLSMEVQALRRCGLSAPKIEYLRDLATQLQTGELRPTNWPSMPDDVLLRELTSVRGVGEWTAQMYMIFQDARLDVLAAEDRALRRAAAYLSDSTLPLTRSEFIEMAEPWRPWRSVASIYLWHYIDSKAQEER